MYMKFEENYTALHVAVQSGRADVVETLLGQGADVHVQGGPLGGGRRRPIIFSINANRAQLVHTCRNCSAHRLRSHWTGRARLRRNATEERRRSERPSIGLYLTYRIL